MKNGRNILLFTFLVILFLSCATAGLAQNLCTINGLSLTVQPGLTVTIQTGGLTNQTSGADSGTIDNAGTITLTGDWTNNSENTVFTTNSGSVQFLGTAAQTIGGTNSTAFYDLIINNTSATGVTLSKPITVTDILTLADGYFYTDTINLLTMNAGSSVSAVSNNSYVYGPMAKTGSTDFTFPVGKSAEYRPISITSLSGSETFTAEYFQSDPHLVPYDVALKDTSLDRISRCEYWILNRAGAINAFVTLSWDSYSCGIDDLSSLSVTRWDGAQWKDHGNGGTTGAVSPATGTIITSAIVSSFGPLTLASNNTNNPLPIELLYFNAVLNKNKVDLNWTTATEINNDYFIIQKTKNGIDFEKVTKVNGSGNSSSVKNYSSQDSEPYAGISYYRLTQVDFDGKSSHSNLIAVNNPDNDNAFSISPNPSIGQFTVLSPYTETLFEIYNPIGEIIYSAQINSSQTTIDLNNQPNGIYFIRLKSENETEIKKLIINK